MTGCCAVGCTNRHSKGFPRDPESRKILAAKERRFWNLVHFTQDIFEQNRADGKRKLKHNAIPTIFPHIPPKF